VSQTFLPVSASTANNLPSLLPATTRSRREPSAMRRFLTSVWHMSETHVRPNWALIAIGGVSDANRKDQRNSRAPTIKIRSATCMVPRIIESRVEDPFDFAGVHVQRKHGVGVGLKFFVEVCAGNSRRQPRNVRVGIACASAHLLTEFGNSRGCLGLRGGNINLLPFKIECGIVPVSGGPKKALRSKQCSQLVAEFVVRIITDNH